MKNRNILMIAYTNYSTDPRVIREAEAASDDGFQVDFIALRRRNEPNFENVNGINLFHLKQERYRGNNNAAYFFSYFQFFFRCFFKISTLYFIKRYSIIHVNNMPDFLVFSALIPKLLGSIIILDIHDPMPTTFLTKFGGSSKSWIYKILLFEQKISVKFSDKVITVHDPIRDDILLGDGIPKEKITIVSNFADDNLFRFNENYHLNDQIKLIFHGTIAKRFGLENVLQSLSSIESKKKIFLKIIGEGDYSSELKNLIEFYKLEDVVDFEEKFYPVKELPAILENYNVGLVSYELSPATNYMLPVKMMEYVSIGLPIITLKNRAISYYFSGDDFFYYDAYRQDTLTELFEKMIENPEIILDKRKKIHELRDRFTWKSERKKYIHLLNNLIKSEKIESN